MDVKIERHYWMFFFSDYLFFFFLASKDKEKGFAFIPLVKDRTVINDGEHVLTIYKTSDPDVSYLKDGMCLHKISVKSF